MHFITFDLQGERRESLEATGTHKLIAGGLDTLELTSYDAEHPITKGWRILYESLRGGGPKWYEFIVESRKDVHDGEGLYVEIYAVNSIIDLDSYPPIGDRRGIASSADRAADIIAEGTDWSGYAQDLGASDFNFYRISPYEALSETLKAFGAAVQTLIAVSGTQVSRSFTIGKSFGRDLGKRFSYTKDMSKVIREIEETKIVTRLYPYGKGEETDTGGYGRRITIAEVNGGCEYIEDLNASLRYGYKGRAISGTKIYEEVDDKVELLRLAKEDLKVLSSPSIRYEADVIDLESYGYDFEGVDLYDTVRIRDQELGLALVGQVLELTIDLDGDEETHVVLGSIRESIVDDFKPIEQALERLTYKESAIDSMANPDLFISRVINSLNDAFKTASSYGHFDPATGLTFMDSPDSKTAKWAMNLGSMGFRIASGKTANGEWDWRTFGTGSGFTADELNAGTLRGGSSFWNLETGYLNIGNKLIFDPVGGNFSLGVGTVTTDAIDQSYRDAVQNQIDATKTGLQEEINTTKTGLENTIDATKTGLTKDIATTKSGLENTIAETEAGLTQNIATTKTGLENAIAETEAGLTKDIATTKTGLENTIATTKTGLQGEISAAKSDLEDTIDSTKTGLQGEISAAKSDLQKAMDAADENLRGLISSTDTSLSSKIALGDATLQDKITAAEQGMQKLLAGTEQDLTTKITQGQATMDEKLATAKSSLESLVASTKQSLTADMSGKADKAYLLKQINLSAETVRIDGKKIEITGETNIETGVIKNAAIANGAITSAKIVDGAITNAKIANAAIGAAQIAYGAVGSAAIAQAAITNAHIASLSASKINGGTIDADTINVTNLNASNLTRGTASVPYDYGGLSNGSSFTNLAGGDVNFTAFSNGAIKINNTAGGRAQILVNGTIAADNVGQFYEINSGGFIGGTSISNSHKMMRYHQNGYALSAGGYDTIQSYGGEVFFPRATYLDGKVYFGRKQIKVRTDGTLYV